MTAPVNSKSRLKRIAAQTTPAAVGRALMSTLSHGMSIEIVPQTDGSFYIFASGIEYDGESHGHLLFALTEIERKLR